MTDLAALLDTWQQWCAHNVTTRALGHGPVEELEADALDALCASCELIELLSGWQWQAIYAARRAGASWEQIGVAMRSTAEQARASYVAVLARQEQVLGHDVSAYREVL